MLLETIASKTRVPPDKLRRIASNASRRYHEFTIPKRDGTNRTIAHPSRPLKALQRFIARNVFGISPIHNAATAYVKGASTRNNASRHVNYKFTVRLDFAEFFPSFDHESIADFVTELAGNNLITLDSKDIDFICKIVCRNGVLPVGAPSSPAIINVMMFEFDQKVTEICKKNNISYSRYADDMFLSGNVHDRLMMCVGEVRRIVSKHVRPVLRLKEEKTVFLSRAGHRSVTGIILTPDAFLSLGRDRKREIKTLIHLAISGELRADKRSYAKGLVAYCYSVEPEFIDRMGKKFSIDVMEFVKTL